MKVLVSVKDKEEAVEALNGGAHIIDLKNPSEGSLGPCFPWVVEEVIEAVSGEREISLAIGDFTYLPGTASLAAFGASHLNINYVKVGLKTKSFEEAIDLLSKVVKTIKSYNGKIKIVAVGYADYSRVDVVPVDKVPEVASEAGAHVAMIDTAIKDGKSLFHFLSKKEVNNFLVNARRKKLMTALAGSLKFKDLALIKKLKPDVVGFRGLACEKGDRVNGRVKQERVNEIINLLHE